MGASPVGAYGDVGFLCNGSDMRMPLQIFCYTDPERRVTVNTFKDFVVEAVVKKKIVLFRH